jgi:hypothetical protein
MDGGDGLAYSYSVYDSYDLVALWADRIILVPANPGNAPSWFHPLLNRDAILLFALQRSRLTDSFLRPGSDFDEFNQQVCRPKFAIFLGENAKALRTKKGNIMCNRPWGNKVCKTFIGGSIPPRACKSFGHQKKR